MLLSKNLLRFLKIFLGLSGVAMAIPENSIGGYSASLEHPVGSILSAGIKLCYVLGGSLLVVAALRYHQHKNNSNQVRFGDVIFALILGTVLIALGLFMEYVYVPSL